MTEFYLRDIQIEPGDPTPLESLSEVHDPATLQILREGGSIRFYPSPPLPGSRLELRQAHPHLGRYPRQHGTIRK